MTTQALPLVTIGMPTYNRAGVLRRAIDSAIGQDYGNLEIVISDNGSSDDTEAMCRALSSEHDRIRYVRQAENKGANFNFRYVLQEARGEYFMWLSDDDWLDPSYVSRCVDILKNDPTYSLVAGIDCYDVDNGPPRKGQALNLDDARSERRVVSYFRDVRMNGAFYGLMRRALITAVPNKYQMGGDWLVVGSMAFLGRIKTLESVAVHRSTKGISTTWESLAGLFGHTGFRKENPTLVIANGIFRDIAWESSVYASLGRVERFALATEAALVIVRRNYSGRHVLRLALQVPSLIARRFRATER